MIGEGRTVSYFDSQHRHRAGRLVAVLAGGRLVVRHSSGDVVVEASQVRRPQESNGGVKGVRRG